eukprot:scaffold28236_cov59-Phaeocystis_antarctica.AAC.3
MERGERSTVWGAWKVGGQATCGACSQGRWEAGLGRQLRVTCRDEDHDDGARVHVLLQGVDALEVVDVEEDGCVRHEQGELPLDRGALVLAGAPDVAEEHVPLVALGEGHVRRRLGRDELDQRLACQGDQLVDGHRCGQQQGADDRGNHAHRDEGHVEGEALAQVRR